MGASSDHGGGQSSERGSGGLLPRAGHGFVCGAVAAMAMTGMREFTRRIGALEEPPPESIVRQRLLGRFGRPQSGRKRAQVELLHWGYGAVGGVGFGILPAELRRHPATGPIYGALAWLGFELGVAPILDLSQAKRWRLADRAALLVDHLLYGFVLSETDSHPRSSEE